MVYDSDYREVAAAEIDTPYDMTAQGADTPGAFVVPTNVSRITKIRIGLGAISADVIADVNSYISLRGAGIQIGEGFFAGPSLATNGAANTAGGSAMIPHMVYKTNIPVKPGGEFHAYFYVGGTDAGTAHGLLNIEYDGFPGRIVDGDIREVALSAANTLVTVNTRAGSTEGDFKPVGTIGEVIAGMAPTLTGHATAGLNAMCSVHLTGPGLLVAGNYKFLSNVGGLGPDTDVHGSYAFCLPERYETPGIRTKLNSLIRAQAQMLESAQAGNAIVGLCYI